MLTKISVIVSKKIREQLMITEILVLLYMHHRKGRKLEGVGRTFKTRSTDYTIYSVGIKREINLVIKIHSSYLI